MDLQILATVILTSCLLSQVNARALQHGRFTATEEPEPGMVLIMQGAAKSCVNISTPELSDTCLQVPGAFNTSRDTTKDTTLECTVDGNVVYLCYSALDCTAFGLLNGSRTVPRKVTHCQGISFANVPPEVLNTTYTCTSAKGSYHFPLYSCQDQPPQQEPGSDKEQPSHGSVNVGVLVPVVVGGVAVAVVLVILAVVVGMKKGLCKRPCHLNSLDPGT